MTVAGFHQMFFDFLMRGTDTLTGINKKEELWATSFFTLNINK